MDGKKVKKNRASSEFSPSPSEGLTTDYNAGHKPLKQSSNTFFLTLPFAPLMRNSH